jgi:hypothetical protein
VEKNEGIIVSANGIQPRVAGTRPCPWCKMREAGRIVATEHVTSSETAVITAVLSPVAAWEVKLLGAITNAQERERLAVEERRPEVPHQVCQFHALREASKRADRGEEAGEHGDAHTTISHRPGGAHTNHQASGHRSATRHCTACHPGFLCRRDQDRAHDRWDSAFHRRDRRSHCHSGCDRRKPAADREQGRAVHRVGMHTLARLQAMVAERAGWRDHLAQITRGRRKGEP